MRPYDHVIVIGVDGAGAFICDADTPNFDRIFANGAVTYSALASNPTISAECWGSMLIGTSPKVHGLTNSVVSSTPYPTDSPFPTLFRRIREAYPDSELGAVCNWRPIINGIVENDPKVYTFTDADDAMTPVINDYIRTHKPEFLFVQYDSVDGVGHAHGYGSKAYLDRISDIDKMLGEIDSAVTEAGIADSTLFIVIADHGGTYNGEDCGAGHGGWTDAEKYVTFAARGKTVNKGTVPQMNVRDLAAITLYALGIEAPDFMIGGWTSQIPVSLFTDTDTAYRDISEEEDAAPRVSNVRHTSDPV